MTAYQAPYATSQATDLSKTLWRKQVLKAGTIDYKGRKITFDQQMLNDLAAAFKAQAYDQVPFLLATADNGHHELPERFRGEIRGLIPTDDGLDALIELSDDGASIVKENPKLGVSCRIVEGLKHADGREYPVAVRHVLGTLDPVVTGMRPWEAISLAHDDEPVIDLTASTYEGGPVAEQLTEEEIARLRGLLATNNNNGDDETKAKADADAKAKADAEAAAKAAEDARLDAETEAELQKLLEQEGAPAGASLSVTGQPSEVDLARAEADQAKQMALQMRHELWAARLDKEKADLVAAGVPPAVVDLAAPLLYGDPHMIDLSNSEQVDASSIMRQVLDTLKGSVDLSAEHAYTSPPSDESKALLDKWAATFK